MFFGSLRYFHDLRVESVSACVLSALYSTQQVAGAKLPYTAFKTFKLSNWNNHPGGLWSSGVDEYAWKAEGLLLAQ